MAIFTNQATLSYSGGTVNSNIATGEIVEVLSATKTAVNAQYAPGSDITYAVNIVNTGTLPFNALTLSDDLGAYTSGGNTLQPLDYVDGSLKFFVDGALQADPTVTAGPPLVITGVNVPAGSTGTILYTARANNFAPLAENATIDNTVTVTGGGIVTPLTATDTVTAELEPRLSINKTVSPSTVTENGQLTYTFVIQNSGNAPATADDDVVVTDTFDPILSNIAVTYNGATWATPTNYTYNDATGLFSTVPGSITVPAATYSQDPATGAWVIDPGVAVLTVTGTI